MEELIRGQGMGYSFDFDNMMQFDGDKLPDKFKMPQLQKFDGTGDPRIHLSQYMTTPLKLQCQWLLGCLCCPWKVRLSTGIMG